MNISEKISNIQNEILFVGSLFKHPDYYIEFGQYTKSKYDFFDEATKFFYDIGEIIYKKRTQTFNKSTITTFVTEDNDRLTLYKKYGGWATIESWMNLAVLDDVKNYFEVLKKYSLLREYECNGYNVEKIITHPKFEMMTALDIYRLIRSKVDRIHTIILTNQESEVLNSKIIEIVNNCLLVPDMGLQMPYPILNDLFRGLKLESMMCVGMLSNAGKSRFLFKLLAYITLVLKEKAQVLLNEMTIDAMRFCLLTTVINNPEFQELHGYHITKTEREITLGLYKDHKGEFIYRERDECGEFTEPFEDYLSRLNLYSSEYKNIINISKWIEDETKGLIFAKDVSTAYDDKSLEFEIRKSVLTQNIKYIFYDTLKQDTDAMGDWAALKTTTTKLSELAKQLKIFIYGSIQLTDDANHIRPEDLTSSQIANAKQLKHVLDTLVLAKEVDKSDYYKYQYLAIVDDWGEPTLHDLDPKKRYYIAVVDKNRYGAKKKILFELDLDLNTWFEVGEVFRK